MRTVIPIVPAREGASPPAGDGFRPLSTLSEPRLSEMAENYRRLGFEVQIRDVLRDGRPCTTCFDAASSGEHVVGTLYVRRREGTGGEDDLVP